jgi:O-antigen/teichoic acid export membrane protein
MTADFVRRWLRHALAYFSATGVTQLLGAVTTFIYVRLLTKDDYAALALAMTVLAFIGVASDLGLGAALRYFRRETLGDQAQFARKVRAVDDMRRILFFVACLIGLGIFGSALANTKMDTVKIAGSICLVGIASWFQVQLSLKLWLMRLEGHQQESYWSEIIGASVRFLVALVLLYVAVQSLLIVLLAFAVSTAASVMLARRLQPQDELHQAETDAATRKAIINYALPTVPSVILYATQDLLIFWLAALKGGAAPIAEVFALGRIGALLAIVGGFATVVVMPRMANVADPKRAFLGGAGFAALLAVLMSLIVALSVLYPAPFLWLIGDRYANLELALPYALTISSIAIVTGTLHQTNRNMGWIRLEPIIAVFQLSAIVGLVFFGDLTTAMGLLAIQLALATLNLLLFIANAFIGLINPALASVRRDIRNPEDTTI